MEDIGGIWHGSLELLVVLPRTLDYVEKSN